MGAPPARGTMADFVSDLVWTALSNAGATLKAVAPSVLAMLTLLLLGVIVGWIAGGILARLARAAGLDERSRAWGLTATLTRAQGAVGDLLQKVTGASNTIPFRVTGTLEKPVFRPDTERPSGVKRRYSTNSRKWRW